jgi:hypothetical protein
MSLVMTACPGRTRKTLHIRVQPVLLAQLRVQLLGVVKSALQASSRMRRGKPSAQIVLRASIEARLMCPQVASSVWVVR